MFRKQVVVLIVTISLFFNMFILYPANKVAFAGSIWEDIFAHITYHAIEELLHALDMPSLNDLIKEWIMGDEMKIFEEDFSFQESTSPDYSSLWEKLYIKATAMPESLLIIDTARLTHYSDTAKGFVNFHKNLGASEGILLLTNGLILIEKYMNDKNFSKAYTLSHSLLKIYPVNCILWEFSAKCFNEIGQVDLAVECMSYSILLRAYYYKDIQNQFVPLKHIVSEKNEKYQSFNDLEEYYNMFIMFNPHDTRVWECLMEIYRRTDREDMEEEALNYCCNDIPIYNTIPGHPIRLF